MKTTGRLLIALCLLAGVVPAAAAQTASHHWGIAASISPWQADDRFKGLYDARGLDLSGEDLRIGITRGRTLGSEWTLMYLRRRIDAGGTLVDFRGETFEFRQGVRLTGFMVEQYGAFGTIANRAQIGVVVAGGLARAEGMVRRSSGLPDVEAGEILTLFARQPAFQLLLRGELAAAFKLAPGTKLRVSGGFAWPGTTIITITGLYFFGDE